MIDLEELVKKYLPKTKEVGLTTEADEATVAKHLKGYPEDMFEGMDEDEIAIYMLIEASFSDAFYTDFEGLGCEDFLKSIQDISDGELAFSDVKTNVSEETLEKGIGTSEVSFKCNGELFSYTAQVYYDWFDIKFMTFVNTVLEKMGIEKKVIAFGNPNGTLITYKKPEFVGKFKESFPMLEVDIT
ncbi:MAG: hypothetical protein J5802_01075 [Butyrivibrio sp.]|nr:hypothetical protein [Butyrivibrio sp.]